MGHSSLAVELRETRGKGPARRMREAGHIPAVLYGHGNEPTALAVDGAALERVLRISAAGMNTLIDLKGGVSGKTVLVKELQREPVRGTYVHVDFYAIDVNEKIEVDVPLHFSGNPRGVIEGGFLEEHVRELKVLCLPDSIPDEIVVDVAEMEIGDAIHVGEIALPEGSELESPPDQLAVAVVATRKAVAEADAAAALEDGEGEAEEGGEAEAAEESSD